MQAGLVGKASGAMQSNAVQCGDCSRIVSVDIHTHVVEAILKIKTMVEGG